MAKLDRRDFLKALAVTSFFGVYGQKAFSAVFEGSFEMLVIGDSLIWGQGLEEKDKFYTLTANWLRDSFFAGQRTVNTKVKAHSGATLKFHKEEAEKYQKIGRDEAYPFDPEVNVGFPSSWKQIEVAAEEYTASGKKGADLVLICGGITDITTSRVFNPKGNDDELRAEIKKYCRDDMYDVVELAIRKNPEAKIGVIGYFPAVSPFSRKSQLLNAWLEALSFPRPLKFVVNNPLGRKLFFDGLRKRAIERSRIWLSESDRNLREAVDAINEKYGRKAIFVQSPLTEENAAEAPNTKLFTMGKGGVVKDQVSKHRIKECRKELPELKRETGIDYPVRLCEIASIGHPDPEGSRAYAGAIKDALQQVMVRPPQK